MPTPTTCPTRVDVPEPGGRKISDVVQIHRAHQCHIAGRIEPGYQLLALPSEVVLHIEHPIDLEDSRPNRA